MTDDTDTDAERSPPQTDSSRRGTRSSADSSSGSNSSASNDIKSELEDEVTTIDETATSFLELEDEMGPVGTDTSIGTGVSNSPSTHTGTIRAQIVDAERVSSEAVPTDYPWQIKTTDALALEFAIRDDTVTVFFAWPDNGPTDRFSRLLAVLEVPSDSFADLHGKRVLLTLENGYYVPVIPSTRPRGSDAGVYGVYAGLAFNLAFGGLAVTGLLLQLWLWIPFVLVNLFALPAATAVDGWYLRTRTDWGQGPWFWAVLAAIPGLNVLSSLLYLRTRRRARPLNDR